MIDRGAYQALGVDHGTTQEGVLYPISSAWVPPKYQPTSVRKTNKYNSATAIRQPESDIIAFL
jgi:hypothetical protein